MTMQVGMVGADGVLIASDTLMTDTPRMDYPEEGQYRPRQTFDASKIILNHARGIAVSCARVTETAEHIASKIFSDLKDGDLQYPCDSVMTIGAQVLASLRDNERKDAHCLIAISRPTPSLHFFRYCNVNGTWGPLCTTMKSSIACGDHLNAAIFWKERYYQRKPVMQLIPLAAHLVVSASKLSSGSIGGLEMVLCDANGLHRLSDASILDLETKANEWDKLIGSLFDCKLVLTFASAEAN